MHFFQFLKSLDDLLYEVVSWMLFYPLTLWRSVRRPLTMMAYAERELGDSVEQRFDENVSPPIQMLLTVLVAHGVELALVGQSELVTSKRGIASLISDDVSLILFRLVAFAIFPLVMAALTVRLRRQPLTRRTLEGPFFAQCYACAPFALLLSLAVTWSQLAVDGAPISSATVALLAIAIFILVEAAEFRSIAGVGTVRAALHAIAGWTSATLAMLAIGGILGGGQW